MPARWKKPLRFKELIASAIGARHQRPLGDTWNKPRNLDRDRAPATTTRRSKWSPTCKTPFWNWRQSASTAPRRDTPYKNPHDAATSLFAGLDRRSKAGVGNSNDRQRRGRVRQEEGHLVMRDFGCGIAATDFPRGIFRVGTRNKDGIDWQQGTFGLGGATTYRER